MKNISKIIVLTFSLLFLSCQKEDKKIVAEKELPSTTILEYPKLIKNTAKQRDIFYNEYKQSSQQEKKEILKKAETYLVKDITNYFEAWKGTPWTFNGTTRTPKEGSIACGYFVNTVLQDMGFNIPRVKWSQAMSSNIKTLSNRPIKDIEEHIRRQGKGIYLVGLDNHVGFIYYIDDTIYFVHSNYYEPKTGVMKQNIKSKNPLYDSKYRMIGKIFSLEMTEKWILNTKY